MRMKTKALYFLLFFFFSVIMIHPEPSQSFHLRRCYGWFSHLMAWTLPEFPQRETLWQKLAHRRFLQRSSTRDKSGEWRRVKHRRKTCPGGWYWAHYPCGKQAPSSQGQPRKPCECALKLSASRIHSQVPTHHREGCLLHLGWAGPADVQSLVAEQSRTQSEVTRASEARCRQAPPGCGNV